MNIKIILNEVLRDVAWDQIEKEDTTMLNIN
jgi:hypothetical protein